MTLAMMADQDPPRMAAVRFKGGTMGEAVRHQDQAQEREARADAAFKPVALPAVAAAVKAAKDKPREAPRHELPPILRKEATLG
jgi:hypothetical protein